MRCSVNLATIGVTLGAGVLAVVGSCHGPISPQAKSLAVSAVVPQAPSAPPASSAAVEPEPSPREQALRQLLVAAEADLPHLPDPLEYGRLAATALGRSDPLSPGRPAEAVAYALVNSGTPEGLAAAGRWILDRQARWEHRVVAFSVLQLSHRAAEPGLADLYEAILSEDAWASVNLGAWGTLGLPIGAFWAQRSARSAALSSLSRMDVPEAHSILERVARDQSRTSPNPSTLAVLTCPGGARRDEFVAQGLASERLIALVLLRDRALLEAVARDRSEPEFLRRWVLLVLEGRSHWRRNASRRMHDDGPDPAFAAPCRERWFN